MGWIDRRLRQHAHDVRVGADGLSYAASLHDDLADLSDIADVGYDLAEEIELRMASSSEMNAWRRIARAAFTEWASRYPGEVGAYADSLADRSDVKLVRSMVPRSLR
jgi:hypothetical protein